MQSAFNELLFLSWRTFFFVVAGWRRFKLLMLLIIIDRTLGSL